MSENNYEDKILEAIQLVVDNAISTADFDKTIQCTVKRVEDATIGKYVLTYQNSTFYAYSTNTDTSYTVGTEVYVVVPGNDMSNDKIIIGSVDKLGVDYLDVVEGEKSYELLGQNVVGSTAEFGLCSYKEDEAYIVYDKEKGINEIDLDEKAATFYIQNSDAILLGANFRTDLANEQRFKGDYGIVYELDFKDNIDGSIVTRQYLFNIDMMSGNPYTYNVNSRQYGIYTVDNENFIEIKNISIYQKDFPCKENEKPNDIFISSLEIGAMTELDASDAAGIALTFVTNRGVFFDETHLPTDHLTIEASVRVKGEAINTSSQLLDYYWFIENGAVTSSHSLYNRLGGSGWACLNDSTTIVIDEAIGEVGINWVPSDHNYITYKQDNLGAETKYKCVAIYSDDTVLTREITIYNFDSDYNVVINSDSGTDFYFDIGSPTLKCEMYDKSGELYTIENYLFVWSKTDNNNIFSSIGDTSDSNIAYYDLIFEYQELLRKIESGEVFENAVSAQKASLLAQIQAYDNIMRVDNEYIYNLQVSSITGFATYKCSVYYSNPATGIQQLIGTASTVITNSLSTDGQSYRLVINNGDVIFKYNVAGISPTNASMEVPQIIQPLTFTLFDDKGLQIDDAAIDLKEARWVAPTANTMLTIDSRNGSPTETDDINNTATYTQYSTLYYNIANTFSAAKTNNTIYLYVTYQDKVIAAKTDLVLIKEGASGTNGTDLTVKLVPAGSDNAALPAFPQVTCLITRNEDKEITYQSHSLNYIVDLENHNSKQWLNIELWEDGGESPVYSGVSSDASVMVDVEWSIHVNNYGSKITDKTYFTIDKDNGEIEFNYDESIECPNCVVQCKVTYKEKDIYVTMPITVAIIERTPYNSPSNELEFNHTIDLIEGTGFREAVYTTDGQTPAYDTVSPFELKIMENINGTMEDISLAVTEEYKVEYDWEVLGEVYINDWVRQSNIEIKKYYGEDLKRSEARYKPVDVYGGLCINNGLKCKITRVANDNGNDITTDIGQIIIPIQLYLNRYGQAALNGWDGNSISISEEEGFILAPQVGAGYKEEDNSFTGVLMGTVKESGSADMETGLFGYYAGTRTIKLDSETGSAAFGQAGAGQIIIDPSSGEAIITSGNYAEPKEGTLDSEGNVIEEPFAGSGMLINLSEPSIKFGTGNFSVDANGKVIATEYTTSGQFDEFLSTTVVSTTLFYGVSLDKDTIPNDADWYIDGNGIDLQEGQYLWQKTREVYGNGNVVETIPVRVTSIADTIMSVIQQYLSYPNVVNTEKIPDEPTASETHEMFFTTPVEDISYAISLSLSYNKDEVSQRKSIVYGTLKIEKLGEDLFPDLDFKILLGHHEIFSYQSGSEDPRIELNTDILIETEIHYADSGVFDGDIEFTLSDTIIETDTWTFFNIEPDDFDSEELNLLGGWSTSKPSWKEGYTIWVRTETIWASNPTAPIYSTPWRDADIESLQDQITNAADDILKELGEEGCVRITGDKIFILDRPELETAQNIVVMSDEGLLFADKGLTWNATLGQYVAPSVSSTWFIDGSYNGKKASIGEIDTDTLETGGIKLRQTNLTDADDELTSGTLQVYNADSAEIANLSKDGFNLYQTKGGRVSITPTAGLEVFGQGNQKIYGNIQTTGEEGLETAILKIEDTAIFDETVSTIAITRTISSNNYNKGIGFCKYN